MISDAEDLIVKVFPTTGRRVKGERADLTNAFEKNVIHSRQKICNRECSRNAYKRFISAGQKMFEKAKYSISEVLMDTNQCDAPQYRKCTVNKNLLKVNRG